MWSPQNRHFCAKSIKNSRKQVKNGSFSADFWSKWRDSNSRPPVPEEIYTDFFLDFGGFSGLSCPKTVLSGALRSNVSTQSKSVDGQSCGQARFGGK